MEILAPKQMKFILESTKKINLAHGSVRSGKTIANTFRVMQAVNECPDSQIWFIGHTASTIYDNVIRLILEPKPLAQPDPLALYRPFCSWRKGDRELTFVDSRGVMKVISTVGAKDAGAVGAIQGKTMSLVYCDEMTLFPESIIEMISTRISNPHSILFATMNPSHPSHILKKWIDKAREGDSDYYELQFSLEDNPFVDDAYKNRVKNSLSGVYYKRLYLGEWTLAEGAIFDFFDRSIHVVNKPPRAADYWIAGVDYGTNNAFAAVLVGVCCGKYDQSAPILWVEKEYYWDYKKRGFQKSSSEFADDMRRFVEPYGVKTIYIDPSAASFRLDLQKRGLHPVNGDNDVNEGIIKMISYLKGDIQTGQLYICSECVNLIRELESYVWHPKCAEKGEDEPLKINDHAVDALRYVINTHKPKRFDSAAHGRSLGYQGIDKEKDVNWRHPNEFGFR
jgi:PBSX family phage terminase large subunit